jgi:hypothetical protein
MLHESRQKAKTGNEDLKSYFSELAEKYKAWVNGRQASAYTRTPLTV